MNAALKLSGCSFRSSKYVALGEPNVSALLGDQREIEVGEPPSALVAIASLMRRSAPARITFLERDDAEGVLRRGDVRVQLQRPTKELLGARQISRSIQISPIW